MSDDDTDKVTGWVEVNLPWRSALGSSVEFQKLNAEISEEARRLQKEWARLNPYVSSRKIEDGSSVFRELERLSAHYPWINEHLGSDAKVWLRESLKKISEAASSDKIILRQIVLHRYAFILERDYVECNPTLQRMKAQLWELIKVEEGRQFSRNPACRSGTLIKVQAKGGSIRTLLIGDVTVSGMDDGCCSSGLADEDIVLSYLDLRPLTKQFSWYYQG